MLTIHCLHLLCQNSPGTRLSLPTAILSSHGVESNQVHQNADALAFWERDFHRLALPLVGVLLQVVSALMDFRVVGNGNMMYVSPLLTQRSRRSSTTWNRLISYDEGYERGLRREPFEHFVGSCTSCTSLGTRRFPWTSVAGINIEDDEPREHKLMRRIEGRWPSLKIKATVSSNERVPEEFWLSENY